MAAKRKVKRLKGSPKITGKLLSAASSGGIGQAVRGIRKRKKKTEKTAKELLGS